MRVLYSRDHSIVATSLGVVLRAVGHNCVAKGLPRVVNLLVSHLTRVVEERFAVTEEAVGLVAPKRLLRILVLVLIEALEGWLALD